MTQSVRCSSCGAPVPLAGSVGQRCFFCLAPVVVPAEIASLLADSGHLERQVAQDLDRAGRYREGVRGQIRGMAVICGTILVVSAWGFSPFILAGLEGEGVLKVLFGASIVLGGAFIFAPLAAWVVTHRLATRRHLRRLPFAVVTLSDRVAAHCPSCGSEVVTSTGLTAICGACGTESLLPAPMVSDRLQRKHARAVVAHEELGVVVAQGNSVAVERQLGVGTAYLVLGWVYLFAVPVLTAAFKGYGFLKQSWTEVGQVGVFTGLFCWAFCLFVGYLTRRGAAQAD